MKKRLVSAFLLLGYTAILVKIVVFKDVPVIRIGSFMLNLGGAEAGHPANLLPFKTILPYLLGEEGSIIAGINLVGNVALFIPIGLLVPAVYRNMTLKRAIALAIAVGLAMEGMQVLFRVGIFDIDDVILNGIGTMIGYWVLAALEEVLHRRRVGR